MSFLELFNQPKKNSKPYMCLACRERFRLKAHAANHKRQAASMLCRARGFCASRRECSFPNSSRLPRGVKKASILAGHFQPGHKHAVILGFPFSA